MPRGINEIQMINLAILGFVVQGNTLGLNRDTTLSLNIHGIKHLRRHFTFTQGSAQLNKAVSQCRLAMVYMGNNGKIPDVVLIHIVLQL